MYISSRITSGHSQTMDSAIGEHLLTINNCRTRYEDDCFSVLHRARIKSHLKFLEAIYISMNRTSLCRQLNNHILNIFGELLDTGVTFFLFFPLSSHSAYILHIYTPFLLNFRCSQLEKSRAKRVLRCFTVLLKFPDYNYQWCLCLLYWTNFAEPVI